MTTRTAPTALVAGGSVAGLAVAWALAERGYRVRVLERCAAPGDDPDAWERRPVPQNRHSHTLTSLGVRALRQHAPAVLAAALDTGAHLLDLTQAAPPGLHRIPADDELVALAVRRTTFERVLHRTVTAHPRVVVHHGQAVCGLLATTAAARVTGVVTTRGERIPAQVVVDATGRAAASRGWLTAAGMAPVPRRSAPTGLRALTRFYRLAGDTRPGPLNRGNAAGGIWEHYAAVVHPAEDRTFAVSLGFLADDPCTRELLAPGAFEAVARLSPFVAPWTAPGVAEPVSALRTMVTPPNTLLGQARGPRGNPVSGLFPVGDAACVTDPLHGRGLSLALDHAFRLAELLHDLPDPGSEQSEAAARLAQEVFRPWFEQGAQDAARRHALWRAHVMGIPGGRRPRWLAEPEPRSDPSPAREDTRTRTGPRTGNRDQTRSPVRADHAGAPGGGTREATAGGTALGEGTTGEGRAERCPEATRPELSVIGVAAAVDPGVWRGLTRVLMTLAPPTQVFDDPDFRARVRAAGGGPLPPVGPAGRPAPPGREALLTAVKGGR